MPFIIDGHNLIPKIPGLNLDDLEDERGLIELLQGYFSRQGKKADVYFDRAAVGGKRVQKHGRVTARFVPAHETADQAIQRHLKRLGKAAANWTVVSSDHEVQNAARQAHARVIEAHAFARQVLDSDSPGETVGDTTRVEDIDEWLRLFEEGEDTGE